MTQMKTSRTSRWTLIKIWRMRTSSSIIYFPGFKIIEKSNSNNRDKAKSFQKKLHSLYCKHLVKHHITLLNSPCLCLKIDRHLITDELLNLKRQDKILLMDDSILGIRCRHLLQRCPPIWLFWSPAEPLPLCPQFCVYGPHPRSWQLDRYRLLKSE